MTPAPASSRPLRLPYSQGWVLIGTFTAMVTFLVSLIELSVVHPLIFGDAPITAGTLWAGLLMPIPLWFITQQMALLLLRVVLWPFKVPGAFELSEAGVRLREGATETSLAWSEVAVVQTGARAIDWDAVNAVGASEATGLAIAQAGEAIAAKAWALTFAAADGRTISVSSNGFKRPVRRAEPRVRAWLAEGRGLKLAGLAEPQTLAVRPQQSSPLARTDGHE